MVVDRVLRTQPRKVRPPSVVPVELGIADVGVARGVPGGGGGHAGQPARRASASQGLSSQRSCDWRVDRLEGRAQTVAPPPPPGGVSPRAPDDPRPSPSPAVTIPTGTAGPSPAKA